MLVSTQAPACVLPGTQYKNKAKTLECLNQNYDAPHATHTAAKSNSNDLTNSVQVIAKLHN